MVTVTKLFRKLADTLASFYIAEKYVYNVIGEYEAHL